MGETRSVGNLKETIDRLLPELHVAEASSAELEQGLQLIAVKAREIESATLDIKKGLGEIAHKKRKLLEIQEELEQGNLKSVTQQLEGRLTALKTKFTQELIRRESLSDKEKAKNIEKEKEDKAKDSKGNAWKTAMQTPLVFCWRDIQPKECIQILVEGHSPSGI